MTKSRASAARLLLPAFVCLSSCSDPERDRLRATVKPSYDKNSGKLTELTSDADKNGRIDTWTEMDGPRALRSRADRNEDGKLDRWEYYDANGQITKVGYSRGDDGKPDAWAYPGADGRIGRVEISSTHDEKRIDRWEYYEGVPAPAGQPAAPPSRAEEDANGDGRPDKWETYENGTLKTVAFDETGDGRPDRRLTYEGTDVSVIESAPNEAGHFTNVVVVKRPGRR